MPTVLKALRIAWRIAPVILTGVVLLLLWRAPQAGSSSAPGQTVTVAGEAALTKPARKWKKHKGKCRGEEGRQFEIVTRDPPADDLERLARQYGFLFGDRELGADLAGMPMPSSPNAGVPPQVRIARMLGEYWAPAMRYGGTFGAGLLENGELEERFDPAPAPRFGWLGVYGVGGLYDLTSSSTGEELGPDRHSRAYAFLEPFQTKRVYWRLEGGGLQVNGAWEPYAGVGAEWRSEPWLPKNRRGLRGIKLD